jgi:ferredoxin-nitrite reductase
MEEVEKKLAFPLQRMPITDCIRAHPPVPHGHLGVHKQKQKGLNYIGVAVPVGRLRTRQMRRIAGLADNYGTGDLRLTVWQNFLMPNIPDAYVETVKRSLLRIGLHHEATSITVGVIACTGNTGCRFAATNTKGQAVELVKYLEKRVSLDRPINIHLTGCPNSCAQHYIGDIGLLGAQVSQGGEQSEGYHVFFGGTSGPNEVLAREVFHGVPFQGLPVLLERVLNRYLAKRRHNESFREFVSRYPVKELQEMFSE